MNKNRLCGIILAVLATFASFTDAKASHLGAADIWATYVGTPTHPLRYAIRLDVYRACEPNQIDLDPTESVRWSSDSCGFATTSITVLPISDDTLDQLCPNYKALNSCRLLTSQWPGFEKRSYTDTIDLPYRCVDWHFTWTQGARNGGIANLCSPSGQSIQVECHFNNKFSNQSSPRFTILPIPYLCIGQPDQFFNGPYDPNGDSLYVENIQPIGCGSCTCGPNGEIPYVTPYSLANPIGSSPTPYVVDPLTGIASFIPTSIGKFVLAFKVSKYDPVTKIFMGSTRRDVQVSVLQCNAPPPKIDSVPQNITGGLFTSTNGNILYACPNTPVSFQMHSTSTSGTNFVFLSVDTSISNTPGSTFTVPNNGNANDTGTFTWTPGDTSLGIHTLVFISTDSTCNNNQPIVLKNYLVVTIKVISGINAIPKLFRSCPLSTESITLNVVGLPAGFPYVWTDASLSTNGILYPNTANPVVHPKDTTLYIVSVPTLPHSCKWIDTVQVNVDNSNNIKITPATPVILCKKGTLVLTATAVGNQPNTNLPCGIPLAQPDTTTHDSTIIVPSLGAYAGFTNANNSCVPLTGDASAHHQYLFRASDMLNSGMVSGVLTGITFSIRQVYATTTYNNVTISLMCTPLSVLNANGSIIPSGTVVYTALAPVTISSAGYITFPFDTWYNWDTTQNLIVDICYSNAATTATSPAFDYYNSGYPSSTYVYNDTANVCTIGTPIIGGYPLYQLPITRFNYFDAPTVPFAYTWQNVYGSNLFSDSTAMQPKVYIDTSARYYVISRGKSGCSFRDSVSIYLDPPRFPYIWPSDTTVCVNTPVQFVATDAKNGYKWYQTSLLSPAKSLNCDSCQTVISTPDTSIFYTTVFSDSVNCKDTAFAYVKTISYPKIAMSFRDTTIKYGSSIMLSVLSLVQGTKYDYVWNPPFTLDNPYLYNPTASPLAPTVYSVIAYNHFCPAYDTLQVNIDYRSHLFVPSAFTPNHDGKNDIFRVANLTYERIIEFRVFNRWGQEVFNATDNNGWDGTWNGNVLDMGVYSYTIRLVYPDGVENNYTGSVTLIR